MNSTIMTINKPDGAAGEREARSRVLSIVSALSCSEFEVLGELAKGGSDRAIAERLCLSLPAVRRIVASIRQKSGCPGRAETAAFAMNGFVELLKQPRYGVLESRK